jgi:prolyl-tRNA synthetase
MRLSELFTKTRRIPPKGEDSLNAMFLIQGGFVEKLIAGVYTFLPLGFRVLKKIENIIREEMHQTLGAQEILMPALHPIENYQKTGRDKIDILFHTELASGGSLVLGQSHEEVIVPLLKHFISSYRDLPLAVYQIQTKFRNELRAKSGLLRGREFIMKDLYSFHSNEKDFENYYEKAKIAYKNIFTKAGIGDITFLTFASGGTFSKYSHEFQALTPAGEDTIYLCEPCKMAINDEIINEQKTCPQCNAPREKLVQKKAIEVGNIFPLKQKFSEAFGLTYKDILGKEQPINMGCYGIGLGRLMGAVVEASHDEKGIIWPTSIAPFSAHLIEINAREHAEKIYENFVAENIEVLYDDRADYTVGEKFADADLIGMPLRIIVSEKTLKHDAVEIKRRDGAEAELVKISSLLLHIRNNS